MKRTLWLLVLIGLLAAGALLVRRHNLEAANRTTELLLDYQAVLDLARASGEEKSGEALFERFKGYGISSLAVPEWTLDDLELEGVLRSFNGLQIRSWGPAQFEAQAGHVYLVFDQIRELEAIKRNLQLALGAKRVLERPGQVLDVAIDLPTLRSMGLGFLPDRLNDLTQKGWRLWLRPENKPIPALAIMENSVLGLNGVQGFIFGGLPNEAVGYSQELKETADWLAARGYKVGYVELDPQVQQKGISTVARTHPDRVVRVMAVVPLQQAKLAPETVVSMYSLGARERNLRLLYLRPYTTPWRPTGDLVATNEALLKGLADDLKSHDNWADFLKGQPGEATTFPLAPERPGPAISLALGAVAMGVLAAVCLLLLEIGPVAPSLLYGLITLGALGTAAWSYLGLPSIARAALALLSSLTLPVLGMVSSLSYLDDVGRRPKASQVYAGSLLLSLRVTLISLAGALMSASLLYETNFLLGLNLFRGVKLLSVAAPLAVLAFYLNRQGGRQELVKALNLDLKLWHALGLGVLGLVGLFYIMRTGNVGAPGGGDSMDTERALRQLLDAALGVRPRFKEFVLGHPAMMLAPFLLWVGWRRLVWLALLAAAVGQASLVDTFAHTHTPVIASLIRTFLGLGVGWVIGTFFVLLLLLLARLVGRFLPTPLVGQSGNGTAYSASNPFQQAVSP